MVAVIQRQTEQGRGERNGEGERERKKEDSDSGLRGNKKTYICYRML